MSLEEQAQALAELDAEMNPAPAPSIPTGFVLGPNGVLLPVSVVSGHSAIAGSNNGTVGGGAVGSSSSGTGSATGGTIGAMGEGLLGMNVTLSGGGGGGASTNSTNTNTNPHHVPSHAEMARAFAEQRLRQQISRSSDAHQASNSIATAASHHVHPTVTTASPAVTPAVPNAVVAAVPDTRSVTPTVGTSTVRGSGAVGGSAINTSTPVSSCGGDLVSRLLSVEEGQEHTLGTQLRR